MEAAQDDAQEVLTAIRETGPQPTHVLRGRLGWEIRRFMPAVSELEQDHQVVRMGDMLSLPVTSYAPPVLPDDVAGEEEDGQEPVSGPEVPLSVRADPPATGGRFLVATEWDSYEDTDVNDLAGRLVEQSKQGEAVLIVAEDDALIFERAVVARRRP